jgi:hypothetical protein
MVQFISLKKQIYFGVRETHISTSLFMLQKTFTQWTLWKLGTKSCNDASAIISFNEDDDGRVTIKGFYDDVTH